MIFNVEVEVGHEAETSGAFSGGSFLLHLADDDGVLTLSGTEKNLRKTLASLIKVLDSMTRPSVLTP